MLSLLKIKNIALIDALEIEFGEGLNLLTGETGSGKSIIVDSLGALTGERVSSDLIKEGEQSAQIEGLFSIRKNSNLAATFEDSGIDLDEADEIDLIVRRELSLSGKNRVFVNNQLVTATFLKKIGSMLVDIHGQGEQAALFDPATHLEMLDEFANLRDLRRETAQAYRDWTNTKSELGMLEQNEAEKLQLLDILKFQVNEIDKANFKSGEDEDLEEEKRRLNNVEKLTSLSEDAYGLLYENEESTVTTLDKAVRKIDELAEYESRFADYNESIQTARAVLEDLAITARDFRIHLEFSPERLEEIENRLAEISRITRKYGGSIESTLAHLSESRQRLENIETAEFREEELRRKLKVNRDAFVAAAQVLHEKRIAAAKRFEKETVANLKAVALEKARFEVRIESPDLSEPGLSSPPAGGGVAAASADGVVGATGSETTDHYFSAKGFDRIEFYFSANVGESPKPLAKVASGGEASRLMLILKTTAKTKDAEKTAVFDEIDAGIGGRVAEAVGIKLRELAKGQQVLCVTHQPQVASLADRHFTVEKTMAKNRTEISIRELSKQEKIEEIARMLAGENISDTARKHASEMLAMAR